MKSAAAVLIAVLACGPTAAQPSVNGPAMDWADGEIMGLLRVEPGNFVGDLLPPNDVWTRRMITAVGPTGKLCVFVPAELKDAPGDPHGRVKALAAEHPNARLCAPPLAAKGGKNVFDAALMVDGQALLHGPAFKAADVRSFHRTLLEELKPGAPYVVVSRPGDATPEAVRQELEAAGYLFDAERRLPEGRFALRFIKPE